MDEEIRQTKTLYCRKAMFYAIGVALIFIILGHKAIGKGLVLGALFSVLNFVIMGNFLGRQVASGGENRFRVGSRAFLSISIRFAILAIPLIIAIKTENIHFYGAVAGVFMVQFAILFNNLVVGRFSKIRKA